MKNTYTSEPECPQCYKRLNTVFANSEGYEICPHCGVQYRYIQYHGDKEQYSTTLAYTVTVGDKEYFCEWGGQASELGIQDKLSGKYVAIIRRSNLVNPRISISANCTKEEAEGMALNIIKSYGHGSLLLE
jgi:hypothetical protein